MSTTVVFHALRGALAFHDLEGFRRRVGVHKMDPHFVPAGYSCHLSYIVMNDRDGSFEAAKMLLEEFKLDVNRTDEEGWTPLMFAAACADTPDIRTIELLIRHGAAMTAKSTREWDGFEAGMTAADIARQKGHVEMADRLAIKPPAPPVPPVPPLSLLGRST